MALKAKTDLGRKLLEYRRKAIAKGMKLLTLDEIKRLMRQERVRHTS